MKEQSEGEATFALHCSASCLRPVPEFKFVDTRNWRFDFAWPAEKIAVEIDGGTWVNGRHNRASSVEADYEKLNMAAVLGWRVLRFTTGQVISGYAIDTVLRILGMPAR